MSASGAVLDEEDEDEEPLPQDIQQMQKMMEQMLGGFGMPGGGAWPSSAAGEAGNPFMSAVNQMFKDFEEVSKEG